MCELLPIDMPTTHSDTEIRKQLDELELVYQSILSYRPPVSNPPILDSSLDAPINQDSDHISGLRPLLEAVKRDLDVAKQVQPAPCISLAIQMNRVSVSSPVVSGCSRRCLIAAALDKCPLPHRGVERSCVLSTSHSCNWKDLF